MPSQLCQSTAILYCRVRTFILRLDLQLFLLSSPFTHFPFLPFLSPFFLLFIPLLFAYRPSLLLPSLYTPSSSLISNTSSLLLTHPILLPFSIPPSPFSSRTFLLDNTDLFLLADNSAFYGRPIIRPCTERSRIAQWRTVTRTRLTVWQRRSPRAL